MNPFSHEELVQTKENVLKPPWDQFVWNELYNGTQTQGADHLN
jgi:hypothetical protein